MANSNGKDDNNLYFSLGALALAVAFKGGFFFFHHYTSTRHQARGQKIPYAIARPAIAYRTGAKKILVTGGCGFLGRHVVAQLLEKLGEKVNVYVFDTMPPPPDVDDRVTYIRGDLTSYTHVEMAVSKSAVVIHCGALVHLANVPAAKVAEVIEQGTKNIVEACLEKDVPGLVYTSSAIVTLPRSRVLTDPVTENDVAPPGDMIGQYAVSKREAEILVRLVDCHVLHTVTLRPGGIYGHGDRILVDSLLSGQPFVGPGQHQVPMVWVEDAARAHVAAAEKLLRIQALKAKAFGRLGAQTSDGNSSAAGNNNEGDGVLVEAITEAAQEPGAAPGVVPGLTVAEEEEIRFLVERVFGKSFLITNDATRDPLIYREFMGGLPTPAPADLPPLNPWDRPYSKSIPAWLVKKLAVINTWSYGWTGFCPLNVSLTPDTMDVATRNWPCCAEAAREALGWTATPWRQVAKLLAQQKRECAEAAKGKKTN